MTGQYLPWSVSLAESLSSPFGGGAGGGALHSAEFPMEHFTGRIIIIPLWRGRRGRCAPQGRVLFISVVLIFISPAETQNVASLLHMRFIPLRRGMIEFSATVSCILLLYPAIAPSEGGCKDLTPTTKEPPAPART
jgi:hypothetical protein